MASTTLPQKVQESCMDNFIKPCLESQSKSPLAVSSKDCLAAAVSGSDECSIPSDDCFKAMYDFCNNDAIQLPPLLTLAM